MVNELNLVFEGNSKGVFHPDETITILVELKLDKPVKKAKGLRLVVTGVAKVKWTEGGGRNSITYHGEQYFLKAVHYFFGKEGGEAVEISSGVHLYKFKCLIPKIAAGSLDGRFGFIRYHAEVNLDIPFMPDMSSNKPFTIERYENLNLHPELQIPNEVEEVKTFCCCICESDPLMLRVSTKHSGFAQGDIIHVGVDIFNKTNMKFTNSLITLNRIEVYNSYSPIEKSKKHVTVVSAMFGKGVESNRNASFQEALQIPYQVAVSNDRVSDVFQIFYEVKVFLKAYKKSSTIEASVPIFIGSIGFRSKTKNSVDSSSLPFDDLPPFCKKTDEKGTKMKPQTFDYIP